MSSVPSQHSLPAPNAHSSPLSGQRAKVFQQMFEEKFSLEGLDFRLPPQNLLLMASDGENSQGSASTSPSGFSSPHSGSSLSIPFPSVLPELQTRANGSTSLPLPGEQMQPPALTGALDLRSERCADVADVLSSKQLTVKFVQDTSKYWYKPEIARDQGTDRIP